MIAKFTRIYVRHYSDNGQTTAYAEWVDTRGQRGATGGNAACHGRPHHATTYSFGTKEFLQARLGIAGRLMGWDTSADGIWKDGKAAVGRVFIQKGNQNCGISWKVSRMVNEHGGETNLYSARTPDQIATWLDGVISAAEEFQRRATP